MTDTVVKRTVRDGRQNASATGTTVNTWLMSGAIALSVLQLFVVPLWLLPMDAAWGWLLLTMPLMTTPFWSLIHETIHGTMHSNRALNDRYGRVLSVLYAAPFVLIKTGHLLHHRFSRTPRERVEIYDPEKTSWLSRPPSTTCACCLACT